MDKNYTISVTDKITKVCFLKEPTVEDILNSIDDITENYSAELRLWDISCGINLSSDGLKHVAEYGKSKFLTSSKMAIVASKDLTFGLSRMFNFYREDGITDQGVFRTEQKALDWLKK